MLELGALVLLGFGVGAFGTLVGAGGGFLLVPALLLIYTGEDADTITAMSLLVVFANASSGSAAYAWQRRVDFVSGAWFALATLPGAVAGALVVGFIPRRLFDAIFAAALVAAGLYLMLPLRAHLREPVTGRYVLHRVIRDRSGQTFTYSYRLWQGMLISVGVGFLSSLLGIGGGIVHVPVLAVVLHFPVHIATATSHFVLALMALEATIVHFATGSLGWNRELARAAAIALGAVAGAQLGARLSQRVHGQAIIRALGAALLLVAVRLTVAAVIAR